MVECLAADTTLGDASKTMGFCEVNYAIFPPNYDPASEHCHALLAQDDHLHYLLFGY